MSAWDFYGFMVGGRLFATKAVHASGFVVSFGQALSRKAAMKEAEAALAAKTSAEASAAVSGNARQADGQSLTSQQQNTTQEKT